MEHFEMVEKLREKAHVSYEDAKAALEAANWDMLDAMVYLEQQGKMNGQAGASYTTKEEEQRQEKRAPVTKSGWTRLWEGFAALLEKANSNYLLVRKSGKTVFRLPLTALLLLIGFAFWFTVIAAVVLLFLGHNYRIDGEANATKINQVMDKAADLAENIKAGATRGKDAE